MRQNEDDMQELIADNAETRKATLAQIQHVMQRVHGLPFPVCLADPLLEDTPIIGVSQEFLHLAGRDFGEVLGQNCRFLLKGVPNEEISRSARKDCKNFCATARLRNLSSLPTTTVLQSNARKNGDVFFNLMMLASVSTTEGRTLVVGLQKDMGSDLDLLTVAAQEDASKAHLENLGLVQQALLKGSGAPPEYRGMAPAALAFSGCNVPRGSLLPWVAWPQSRSVVRHGGSTILRRDAGEMPRGAHAMSLLPVDRGDHGEAIFKIRVNAISQRWATKLSSGGYLPFLGFTEIAPTEMPATGCGKQVEFTGKSICAGGDCMVYRRTQDTHFERTEVFKPVPQEEILGVLPHFHGEFWETHKVPSCWLKDSGWHTTCVMMSGEPRSEVLRWQDRDRE